MTASVNLVHVAQTGCLLVLSTDEKQNLHMNEEVLGYSVNSNSMNYVKEITNFLVNARCACSREFVFYVSWFIFMRLISACSLLSFYLSDFNITV